MPGLDTRGPVIEEVKTIRPYFCARIAGKQAFVAKKVPVRLTRRTASQSSSDVSSIRDGG